MNEVGSFWKPKLENGKPVKPSTATIDINLVGTIYSAWKMSETVLGSDSHETVVNSYAHQPPTWRSITWTQTGVMSGFPWGSTAPRSRRSSDLGYWPRPINSS